VIEPRADPITPLTHKPDDAEEFGNELGSTNAMQDVAKNTDRRSSAIDAPQRLSIGQCIHKRTDEVFV
jgi:hypothetical protein